MLCKAIDRWTSEEFYQEMVKQDLHGKYGVDWEEMNDRKEYWKFRTKYLEGRPKNFDQYKPFIVISNFPIAKLESEHEVEYWDLVGVYSQDIQNAPPIFVILSDYMVSRGAIFPRINNGHHRVAAAKFMGVKTIKIVTDSESWENLRELCD